MFTEQAPDKSNKQQVTKQTQENSQKQAKKGMQLPDLLNLIAPPVAASPETKSVKSGPFVSFKPLPDSFIQKKILRKMTSKYNNNMM